MPDLLIEMHRQNMQLGQIMHFRRCHTHSFWISTALAALGYLIGSLLTRHLAIQLSTEWQTSKEATKDWLGLDGCHPYQIVSLHDPYQFLQCARISPDTSHATNPIE